jgi:uncharacterized protein
MCCYDLSPPLRCMLYRTIDHFSSARHAGGKACRGALCSAYGRQSLCDFRSARTPCLLLYLAAFGGDVWCIARGGDGVAVPAGAGDEAGIIAFMRSPLPPFHLEVTAESPCAGHCTTVLGDDVCRSCLRTFDEVTRWVEMNEEERRAVNRRIALEQWEQCIIGRP